MRKSLLAWAGIAAGLVVLAGCVEIGEPIASPSTNLEVLDLWIGYAKEEGMASDRQLQILEDARASGELSAADMDIAAADFYQCLEDAGVEYIDNEEEAVAGSGVWLPAPLVVAPDPDSELEGDILYECQFRHEIYVASAYSSQAWVVEAENRVWTSDAVRSCLEARGYPVADDVTTDEIQVLNAQDIESHIDDAGFTPCVSNSMSWSPDDAS